MGNIVPTVMQAASSAGSFFQAVPFASDIVQSNVSASELEAEQQLALAQLQQKQKAQEQKIAAENAAQKDKIAQDAAAAEEARRASLRRAVARQRASFGASGVGNAGGGSAQAVLLGLFEDSEQDRAANERLSALKSQALDSDLSTQKSLNVLQRTQLQEKQRLEREMASAGARRSWVF